MNLFYSKHIKTFVKSVLFLLFTFSTLHSIAQSNNYSKIRKEQLQEYTIYQILIVIIFILALYFFVGKRKKYNAEGKLLDKFIFENTNSNGVLQFPNYEAKVEFETKQRKLQSKIGIASAFFMTLFGILFLAFAFISIAKA